MINDYDTNYSIKLPYFVIADKDTGYIGNVEYDTRDGAVKAAVGFSKNSDKNYEVLMLSAKVSAPIYPLRVVVTKY